MKNKINYQNKQTENNFYKKTVLDNGITVITDRVEHYKSFALGIFVNAGSRDDMNNKSGTAHFVEHSIFRKSKKYNSKQIANKFEEFGAYTNAFTTQEITCFYVRALKPHLKKSLNLLLEIVLNPDFVEIETEKERQIILEEIKSYEDDIEENISDLGDKLIFGDHTLGNPILGYSDTVESITINDLQYFHQKYYNPSNLLVCLVGDIDHNLFCESIDNYLNSFSFNKKNKNEREKPIIEAPKKQIENKHIQQSHLLMLGELPDTSSSEKYSIGVMNTIFGDGMSSRLYQNLRDKYGYAYSIYSSIQLYSDIGTFSIYAALDFEKLELVRDLIFKEISKLKNITIKELNRAKEQYITGITLDTESLSSRMQALAKNEFSNGKFESIDVISNKIKSLETVDIVEISQKYLIDKDLFELSILPNIKNKKKRERNEV